MSKIGIVKACNAKVLFLFILKQTYSCLLVLFLKVGPVIMLHHNHDLKTNKDVWKSLTSRRIFAMSENRHWVQGLICFLLLALGSLCYAQDISLDEPIISTNGVSVAEDKILKESPNLDYERELLAQHAQVVANYNENYGKLGQPKQPANKSEPCIIKSDILDSVLSPNSMVFWEGSCVNDQADGFGRVYVISSGRKTFEMLTNFHAEEPDYTTTYYTKNTKIDSRTVYFYGKTNRFQSSGILITQSRVDNDLLVGMQTVDKLNLITYQKETSKNSKYVLNIKDYGNFIHFIHDLIHTPYRSLAMSYRLTNRANGANLGYSFTGHNDGSLTGNYIDKNNNSVSANIPSDVLDHIINVNNDIDVNVEGTLKNVIESVPVVNAYKNVVCNESYQNPTCTKMKCKEICDLNTEITPDTPEVKELLLRLVDHHNNKPLIAYINKAKSLGTAEGLQNSYADHKDALIQDTSTIGTIENAYDSASDISQPLSMGSVNQNGMSFGNQVDADSAVRDQLYQAQGPSMVDDDEFTKQIHQEQKRAQIQNQQANKIRPIDPLSKEEQAQMRAQLQAKINKERALRKAQEAEERRHARELRQDIIEAQRADDRYNDPVPIIDYSQVDEGPMP